MLLGQLTKPYERQVQKNNPVPLNIHNLNQTPVILDVWEDNFEDEFQTIMNLIDQYPVVAMVNLMNIATISYYNKKDTEFPGTVFELDEHEMSPMGHYVILFNLVFGNFLLGEGNEV